MSNQMVPIWSPADTREVFERACTVKATEAANAPVIDLVTRKVIA